MTVQEIRSQFLAFFESKKHQIVESAPMVIKNDPTLMFTNAGMNQFKDYFLGHSSPTNTRVADTQKCLRVSGKHNDLEEVGVDTYHHTMFEMLGNWSFGDYFKKDAIDWAWELLTEVYKIDKSQLYITVFEGDEEDGTDLDTESIELWKKHIAQDRIILADKKDNFWEMGDVGPCGPCSEIHVDIRDAAERAKGDGRELVNKDHPQVIEIWNLVFMQYQRMANGKLEKLPATHVDTGMGLERLAMVLQGKQSNYDTDLFQALIQPLEKISGFTYGKQEEVDIALRVIADHVRAIAFSICDGQLPSNTGAGYVIRRILRRAVRYGYSVLNLKESFMAELSKVLVAQMGDAFPQLKSQKELVEKVIREEENSFFRTLEQGLKRIETSIEKTKSEGKTEIAGEEVFELYDTFGFPIDLTSLIAAENKLSIDEKGFNTALNRQKERARAATAMSSEDWVILADDETTEFIGYDNLSAEIQITKYRKVSQKKKTFYQLVFNYTPFYAEGGGQVGDTGYIEENGNKTAVFDTKKENNLIIHLVEKLPEKISAKFTAVVNHKKRELSAANHSATHLLHHALRSVLGTHVEQKGSLVNPNYLRFDFSHFSKVSDDELEKIEALVSAEIRSNINLDEHRAVPMSTAQELGALALFGEKYGDLVRVIKFGNSVELCGGTHVSSTGKIGLFKIISEGAVAAGVRRIEAITNSATEDFYKDKASKVETLNEILKNPKDLTKAVDDLVVKNKQLQKQIEQFQKEKAMLLKSEIKNAIENINGINFIGTEVELDGGSIKDILFQLKAETENLFAVIGGKNDGKCTLSIIVSDNLIAEKELNAGNIIREASKFIQGGGGGQPAFATAGGKNPDGLKQAINLVKEKIK